MNSGRTGRGGNNTRGGDNTPGRAAVRQGEGVAESLLRALAAGSEAPTVQLEYRLGERGVLFNYATYDVRFVGGAYQVTRSWGRYDTRSTPRAVLDLCAQWAKAGFLTRVAVACAVTPRYVRVAADKCVQSCEPTVFWQLRAAGGKSDATRFAEKAAVNFVQYGG